MTDAPQSISHTKHALYEADSGCFISKLLSIYIILFLVTVLLFVKTLYSLPTIFSPPWCEGRKCDLGLAS